VLDSAGYEVDPDGESWLIPLRPKGGVSGIQDTRARPKLRSSSGGWLGVKPEGE
jgi:hypothetical protein